MLALRCKTMGLGSTAPLTEPSKGLIKVNAEAKRWACQLLLAWLYHILPTHEDNRH